MAFSLLLVAIFIMFFQPADIFPGLTAYQPFRNTALLALVAYVLSGVKSSTPFFSNRTNKYFVLFAVLQIISSSTLWITGGFETLNFWIRIGIIYYLILKSVNKQSQVTQVCVMIVLSIGYLSYYSLSKYVVDYMPAVRAGGFGLYENANDVAIIMVVSIPLALLIANDARSLIVRYLFLAIACIFAFNILFTGSRNGLLGLMVVGAMGLIFSKRTGKLIKSLLLIALLSAVFTVGIANVLSRRDLSGLSGDDSSENRLVQWEAGLRMLCHHPFLGVGPLQFGSNAEEYGGIRSMDPHNTLLQVFVETGILGGIIFSFFTFYPIYTGWRMSKDKSVKETQGYGVYKFIMTSLIGFWVCAFFSNRYQFTILYVLVALLVAIKDNIIEDELASQKDIRR